MATMNQAPQQGIEQQVVQLVQAAVTGDQKATQQIEKIMQAAQQGNQEAIQIAQIIQKVIQAMQAQQGVKAQLGAKLAYINKLKGICPEGSEKVYLKNGGCMCKQKVQKGAELKKKDNKMNAIQKFKAEKGIKTKVAYHDIDKKTYEKLPESTRNDADNHYLGRATSDNTNGSYNISHKPTAADSTTIDRKHMSPDMQKKYPLKKTEKNACGSKMKKKK